MPLSPFRMKIQNLSTFHGFYMCTVNEFSPKIPPPIPVEKRLNQNDYRKTI